MPPAILEAMARGKPVLATAVGGIPEALGETGRLVGDPNGEDQRTCREIVETLLEWKAEPDRRRALGEAASERAGRLFREERMLSDYNQWIDEILARISLRGEPVVSVPAPPRVGCNICGWQGRKFADFDCGCGHIFANAACPSCQSHPRHRSLYLCLQRLLRADQTVHVLHFAPERCLTSLWQAFANVRYLGVDLHPAPGQQKEDITALTFGDRSFELIVCLHVLEHVEDDRKALSEIRRVLTDDGIAILDVPIDDGREKTYEDPSIRSRAERTRAFWQGDHVRLYGRDFGQRLQEAGLTVRRDESIQTVNRELSEYHGLQSSPLFLCGRGRCS